MLLDKLAKAVKSLSSFDDDKTRSFLRGITSLMPVASGVKVNDDTAMNYSACWRATRLLSETTAGLPLLVHQRVKDKGSPRAPSHPIYGMLKETPNPLMTSFSFRDTLTGHLINRGNGFANIQRAGATPVHLWPIHPSRIEIVRDDDHRLVYLVHNNDGKPFAVAASDMIHVTGPVSGDGITGKGVIEQARETIGFGIATERYGATLFGNGARPSSVLTVTGILDDDAAKRMRASWVETYGGPDGERVAILEQDTKYQAIGTTPEDAQFLQTRQHNITEIARWYGVPPHMLFELSRSTFNNIEHQGLEFLIYSLMPWLIRWEQELNRKLLSPVDRGNGFFIKHEVKGLARGDMKSRFESYAIGKQWGWYNSNVILGLEDMEPIGTQGDVYLVPMNMTPAHRIDEVVDAQMRKNEPPAKLAKQLKSLKQTVLLDGRGHVEKVEEFFATMANRIESLERNTAETLEARLVTIAQLFEQRQQGEDVDRAQVAGAIQPALEHVFGRLIRKECKAVARFANEPGSFLAKLDEFYEQHEAHAITELRALVSAYTSLAGDAHDGERLLSESVAWYVKAGREAFVAAAECQPEELSAAVERVAESWECRGAELARGLVGK